MTRQELCELREKRAAIFHKMRELTSNRDSMSPAEARAYDDFEREFDALGDQIAIGEAEHRPAGATGGFLRAIREGDATVGRAGRVMDGPFLGAEARMADWTREHGLDGRSADDQAEPFSLGAAVRGMATGRWDGAESERRALGSGADATGGVLVPSLVASEVIDALRDEATAINAGARIVPMAAKSVTLPQVDSLPTPGWRKENDPVVVDDPSFAGIQLTAKTLAVLCKVPVELFEDVSAEASQAITDALTTSLALELDRAAYFGAGQDDSPTGLVNTSGVAITPLDTNGAVPDDYSALVAAYFACRRRNARPNAAVYSERTAETFAGLTATDGQPLMPPPALADLAQFSTNAVPDDETVGTGTDATSIIVGQFDQLAIGVRPELGFRVASSREAFMSNMQVGILVYLRADIGVIRPAAFDVRSGVLAG